MTHVMERLGFKRDWQDKRVWHSRKHQVEICLKWGGPALHLSQYQDHGHTLVIGLGFASVYVKTPKLFDWERMEHQIGFSFTEDSLQLGWGRKTTVHWYPWGYNFYTRWEAVEHTGFVDREYRRDILTFVEVPQQIDHGKIATKWAASYRYTLRSGEVQQRKAELWVGRMEWRQRWLAWLPLRRKVSTTINVSFDAEVGERTGSWEGGVIGCYYDMRPGETPEQTLRRMERERKFE